MQCLQSRQQLLQVLIKKDGYANQPEAEHAHESEELLTPLDEAIPSNTIPELSSMSQVLAPNSIDAEMQSISLHSPRSTSPDFLFPEAVEKDENSDPNQTAARQHPSTGLDSVHHEMQPMHQKKSGVREDEVCGSCLHCCSV